MALLAVVTVPLTGGGAWAGCAEVRFRAPWLAIGGWPPRCSSCRCSPTFPGWAAIVLHLASYAAVLAFIWLNRTLPGLWLVGIGGLSNLVVIAANGG